MRLRVRISAAVAVTAALLGLPAGLAGADPGSAKSAEVIKALAMPAQPTDFVVLVDTGASMGRGKRPSMVRSQLAQLLKLMQPTDRLALFSYGAKVTTLYRGLAADQSSRILNLLPDAAGTASDQGAALAAGVAELARDGANAQAVVVVITDGPPEASSSSRYASEEGKAWRDVIDNGSRLAGQRPIVSYQLSLAAAAGPTMQRRVFPATQSVTPGAASGRIAAIRSDLDQLRASRLLDAELQAPITVHWTTDLDTGSSGWLPLRISIQSPYPHVPVVLNNLTVAGAGGWKAEVRDLPATIELAPGQTTQLRAQVRLSGDGDLRDLNLGFRAAVDSPWRAVLTDTLGLTFSPQLVGVSGISPRGALERSLPTLVTVGGLLGLSVLVWWLGGALISPRMKGELIISRHAEELARVPLHGRRQDLSGVRGGALAALAGTVYGARPIRGAEREVRVDLAAGKNWSRGVIQDGHVIQMGDIEIAYSSELGAIVGPALVH